MKNNRLRFIGLSVLSVMLAFVISCGSSGGGGGGGGTPHTGVPNDGGSGGGGATPVAAPTVSGIAAKGAALQGKVYLKDSNGVSMPPFTIDLFGSFSLNVSGLVAPYYLYVEELHNNGQPTGQKFYSIAMSDGTANINPLTNLALAAAAGVNDPAEVFNDPGTNPVTQNSLDQALADILSMLNNLLFQHNAVGINPFTDVFAADHTGLDAFFDAVGINIDTTTGNVTFTDLNNYSSPFMITATGGGIIQIQESVADLSLDINEASLLTSWLTYSNDRTLFLSTSITSVIVNNGAVTVKGSGEIHNVPGYSFTATVRSGPDEMGMEIKDAAGNVHSDSISPQQVTGGAGFVLAIL